MCSTVGYGCGDLVAHYLSLGHQQLINQVCYSPNGRIIASASFDKSVKLWDGKTGKYDKSQHTSCH